jgi:hypothetical protein
MRIRAGKGVMLMAFCAVSMLGVAACAKPSPGAHRHVEPASPHHSHQPSNRPQTTPVAEREFSAAAIVLDDRSVPRKVWLMSSPSNGAVQAIEFFSGERVADVRVERLASSAPGQRWSYSFTDNSGHRYAAVYAIPSAVDTDQPSAYAGWQGKDGTGQDVVLGATLFERYTTTMPDGVAKTVNRAVDPRPFFDGQPACEEAVYVARTQASNAQDSETGFVPRAKILADYDAAKRCWNTQPIHAVNLDDNTFIVATRTRVFRLGSKDLAPVGDAPSIRVIDVKE